MLTACSPKEEDEWRSRLEVTSAPGNQEQAIQDIYSSIYLDIKSLGTVFGKQGMFIHIMLSSLVRLSDIQSRWHCAQDFNSQGNDC